MSIEGKKIFITGSTGGIGAAICNKYLRLKFLTISFTDCSTCHWYGSPFFIFFSGNP